LLPTTWIHTGALLECLTPSQRLTAAGMAVLLPHHPHKGKTVAGQAARGSGALPSPRPSRASSRCR
jgi:hypothetical protein